MAVAPRTKERAFSIMQFAPGRCDPQLGGPSAFQSLPLAVAARAEQGPLGWFLGARDGTLGPLGWLVGTTGLLRGHTSAVLGASLVILCGPKTRFCFTVLLSLESGWPGWVLSC